MPNLFYMTGFIKYVISQKYQFMPLGKEGKGRESKGPEEERWIKNNNFLSYEHCYLGWQFLIILKGVMASSSPAVVFCSVNAYTGLLALSLTRQINRVPKYVQVRIVATYRGNQMILFLLHHSLPLFF